MAPMEQVLSDTVGIMQPQLYCINSYTALINIAARSPSQIARLPELLELYY